jgi:hypothetical protein
VPPPNNTFFAIIHNDGHQYRDQHTASATAADLSYPARLLRRRHPVRTPYRRAGRCCRLRRKRPRQIQQGKLPPPPSAWSIPRCRLLPRRMGRSAPTAPVPANVSPNRCRKARGAEAQCATNQRQGTSPAPGRIRRRSTTPIPTKLVPQTQPVTTSPAVPALGHPGAGGPKVPGSNEPASVVGQPKAGGSAQAPDVKPAVPEAATKKNVVPRPPPPPSKPAAAPIKPTPQAAPKPAVQPQIQRATPPPPPQIARPAPPPPPPPRPAAPPPRPAAPAAAKKCPPNAPKC